jgi:negative regulator of sigma E activity
VLNYCDTEGERLTIVGEVPLPTAAAAAMRRFRDRFDRAFR